MITHTKYYTSPESGEQAPCYKIIACLRRYGYHAGPGEIHGGRKVEHLITPLVPDSAAIGRFSPPEQAKIRAAVDVLVNWLIGKRGQGGQGGDQ